MESSLMQEKKGQFMEEKEKQAWINPEKCAFLSFHNLTAAHKMSQILVCVPESL